VGSGWLTGGRHREPSSSGGRQDRQQVRYLKEKEMIYCKKKVTDILAGDGKIANLFFKV
jgi:hypothetical protein